jgi:cell division protein FtsB
MPRPTRMLALGGLALIALLYWKPIRAYEHTKAVLARRQAEVASLREQQHALQQRLAAVDRGQTLVLEARRLGLVKPGEELFIVRGIAAWRQRRHAHR